MRVLSNFEKLLHANNTQQNSTKFSGKLGGRWKNDAIKNSLKKFKQRPSKLKEGYSQDLVKQTVDTGIYILALWAGSDLPTCVQVRIIPHSHSMPRAVISYVLIYVTYIHKKVVCYCHYDDFSKRLIVFAHKRCKINIVIKIFYWSFKMYCLF